ncbi:hypothetical protein Mapa_006342 [Marchantia paleacea]|nr:hypothetical protein Mapa_006342 [Marchantia paleacea]
MRETAPHPRGYSQDCVYCSSCHQDSCYHPSISLSDGVMLSTCCDRRVEGARRI